MKRLLKNSLLSSIIFFTCNGLYAQLSLVRDGSFEDTVVGWQTSFGFNMLTNWGWLSNGNGSFPLCSPIFSLDAIPINPWGLPNNIYHTYPRTGRNAQDIATYNDYTTTGGANWHGLGYNTRTPIRSKLRSKLIAGKTYCATLYAIAYRRQSYFTTNGLGMYFDNGQLDTAFTVLKDSSGAYGKYATPQVIAMYQIDDSNHWQRVQGTFVANGTEEYITIGNWLSDSATTKILNGPQSWFTDPVTGVLLEDVSVIPIDITTWLRDTACVLGDSVWVGLPPLDYTDGKWHTLGNQYLSTGAGFWYTPTQKHTQFVQEIEVCGALKRDTINVYAYPLSVTDYVRRGAINCGVYPNPNAGSFELVFDDTINENKKITVIDMLGRVVFDEDVFFREGKAQLHTKISAGVYSLVVENEVHKLIVE